METSQRIVDVLLRALMLAAPARVPAASAGTMSNLTIGGVDPAGASLYVLRNDGRRDGSGGEGDGISGVQTHMTNSLNTPVEALLLRIRFGCGDTGIGVDRVGKAGCIAGAMGW